jgi:hypothetical protein
MAPEQLVGLAVNAAIYLALIGFVLYRQMSAQPLQGRRLVLLPAALGFFGVQLLARQPLAADLGTIAILAVGLAVGLGAGTWRGTTFRVWTEAATVTVQGTMMTLVTWGVLLAVRLPFAFLGHLANRPQGFAVGELLLALAVTFGAQNAVIWRRARGLRLVPAHVG